MKFVEYDDLREWLGGSSAELGQYGASIGQRNTDPAFLADVVGMPVHLQATVRQLINEDPATPSAALESIPFHSLCKGLLLPLSGLTPEKVAFVFGIASPPPPARADREALLADFLKRDVGLSLVQKLSCVLGDPFRGRPGTLRRDSLIRLLLSVQMKTRRELLDRLAQVGDVAVLFAEQRPSYRCEPALTAAEVLEALRFIPKLRRKAKFAVLRSLLSRCGKLEAYFLAKLVLRKAGFGFDFQGALIARTLGEHFGAPPESVAHAIALTDTFNVARILAEEGPAGLRAIQLQPLVPVRPALATGKTDDIKNFPVWVERKYDGIRLVLHKSSDARGSILCGAYTRSRLDWLELVPGLDQSIRALPAASAIVDGELYGTMLTMEGPRPATVYEVYSALQGEASRPVNLRFAAFDLLYLNGHDLTAQPLHSRRQNLQTLVGPLANFPLRVPMKVAEGQLAQSMNDVNRLYHHFRNQGYEGVIVKKLDGPYLLAQRDPTWLKRKPAITLDLVLVGGVFAVTEKQNAGLFGSYVIAARTREGDFVDVGDVAGVDRQRDMQLQGEIMREGLITGRRIIRKSMSGERPGIELRPHIVATIRFEGVIRDPATGEHKLRDPKLVVIRSDKSAMEANTLKDLEELYLRQRVS